jgi:hypothetical protein
MLPRFWAQSRRPVPESMPSGTPRRSGQVSTLRNNFYREPYALEPREVALERAASLHERCTALDTSYS